MTEAAFQWITYHGYAGIFSLLVFGIVPPRTRADLAAYTETDETSELVVATDPIELAFPLHNEAVQRFWRERPLA